MILLQVVILLLIVLGSAYLQLPVIVWTIGIGLTLVLLSLLGKIGVLFLSLSWILYLAALAFATLTKLRQRYFSQPLIKKIQKNMPPISSSERETLEAGDVWWEKELFCGRPQWKKLLAIPQPQLTQEEQAFIDKQVETLCEMVADWKIFNDHDLPKEVWDYLKKERFLGMIIPKQYGGLGFSALAHSTVVLKIATRSPTAAVDMMVPNSLGPGELLTHYGTQEQKDYYLPRLARGEEIPCFALTAPESGSDAASIADNGVVCRGQYEGKEVLGIRLNWDKRYITLAPIATVLGLAFRLFDPDHLLGQKEDIGITLCLIPTSLPNIEIGNRHFPMYLAFMNGPTRGKDVFIPIDFIIGGPAMAGRGWHMLMECLSIGRSISLPALGTAAAKMVFITTGAYARLRRQFNLPLSQFEGVEEALGHIAVLTYIAQACRVMTAGAVDIPIKPAIASAIAKYHMTEMSREILTHGLDIQAGFGIQTGPRNVLAQAHLANPIAITVEGANILTRNLIIFGLGAIRCHPYILNEMNLINAPDSVERTKKWDRLLLSHIGYLVSNFTRSLWMGLTGGQLIYSPVRGKTAKYYKQLTRMSSALALFSDIAMLVLGGNLKRKERISARLGDILSQLYLASTVLKYFEDHGKPASDIDYVRCSVELCLYKIQIACDELANNFPLRWLSKIIYTIIFPWGPSYQKPSDHLYHRLVKQMIKPSEFRQRMAEYFYLSKEDNDPIKRMENALNQIEQVEPIMKKFQIAVREGKVPFLGTLEERLQKAVALHLLSHQEMQSLMDFNQLYQEIIQVNEFSFDLQSIRK